MRREKNGSAFSSSGRANGESIVPLPDASELEDVGILEKEIALLGEEQAEPRQIDLPIVDFGRREIGVERQSRIQRRRDLVEDIERRLRIGVIGARLEIAALDGRQRRHDIEAQPLPQVRDPRELARDRRALRPVSRDPAHRLVVARDSPVEVEAPRVGLGIERDRLERDPRLGDPAVVAL